MASTEPGRPFRELARETGRLVPMAIRLVWRASPRMVLAMLLLIAVQGLMAPLQLALSKAVLDRAALDLGLATAPDPVVARLPFGAWIALAAAALAVGQLVQPFAATFQAIAGDRLTGYVTEQLIAAANRWRGLARFEDPGFVDDLQRARGRAAHGGLELMVYGARAGVSLCTAAGMALVLAALHPLLPFGLVLAALPQMAREWEYGHRTGSHLYVQTPETRRMQYSREMTLAPGAAKDVRLYALGPFFRRRYDTHFGRTIGQLDRLRRSLAASTGLASALAAAATGAVYVYVAWLIARGERSVGDLALFGGAATMLHASLAGVGTEIGFLPRVLGFLPSLFRVLAAPPDLPLPAAPRAAPQPVRQGFTFEHVAFGYPGANESASVPVLQDVSCSIRPGECVALVGHNGAGKTTLVKLLLRLYDPSRPPGTPHPPGPAGSTHPPGRILLDGVDLREYDLDALRRQTAVIFQDFVRYELTAGENIALGDLGALEDPARLLAAAAQAGADELVERLPQGLETQLGREFGGRELSGGEWQKLALARAFVRATEPPYRGGRFGEGGSGEGTGAQLLVLDEPTAALDVQTEYDVYLRFRELTRGRMTLLISHRFSTVRMADRILYLAGGRIQEEGTHAELMARGGAYARLYARQAAQYIDPDAQVRAGTETDS